MATTLTKTLKRLFGGLRISEYLPEEIARDRAETKNEMTDKTKTGFSYRLAQWTDIYDLLAVERDVYGGQVPWTERHFEGEIVANPRALFIVGLSGTQVVAFIGFRVYKGAREVHITNFGVKTAFQRHGVGRHLLEATEKFAQNLESYSMSLEVRRDNLGAQAFYRRFGFETLTIQSAYYDDGVDAVTMVKNL